MGVGATTDARLDRGSDQDYAMLAELLKNGHLIPFLGAGASLQDQPGSAESLPTGRELAKRLAWEMGLDVGELDNNDLIEVASCYELFYSRPHLEEALKKIFAQVTRTGRLHHLLAELIPSPKLIMTTNYDTLIEDAFRKVGRQFHLLMTKIEWSRGWREGSLMWWKPDDSVGRLVNHRQGGVDLLEPDDIPIIYKVHGGAAPNGDWVNSIITEDDYFEIGGRLYSEKLLPPAVSYLLKTKGNFLFLGHSLRDVHVRFLIGQWAGLNNASHFMVAEKVSRINRARVERLGVRIFEQTMDDFLTRLKSILAM